MGAVGLHAHMVGHDVAKLGIEIAVIGAPAELPVGRERETQAFIDTLKAKGKVEILI